MATQPPPPIRRSDAGPARVARSTRATNRSAWPALHLAAAAGDAACVRAILSEGAPVDARSFHADGCVGATALHCAAVSGTPEVVRLLLEAGADPQARDEAGYTPLLVAAERGHVEVAKALVRAGADVRDEVGDTGPLALARRGRHARMVGLLRQLGAR